MTEATGGFTKASPRIPLSGHPEHGTHSEVASTPLELGRSGRVIIEIAGVCQATCPYCAQNSGERRRDKQGVEKPGAYMPLDMFRATISRLRKSEAFTKGRVNRVYLYNWGEPFLAPSFNEYLEILKENGLYAVISSNFQKVPEIWAENLPVINEVIFSLSGMSDDTYGRIHGGSIEKVLSNLEAFRARLRRHSPKSKMFMSWHRYTFNEHEFWDAYRYSRKQGMGFTPFVAFLNDLVELIQAAGDRLPENRKQDAQRDIFYDHMVQSISSYQENGSNYDCPAWDDVVIDEKGRMLMCCGADSATPVGHALETKYEEMRQNKVDSALCKICLKRGVAEWGQNLFHARNQLPWPSGGGLDFLRLKLTYNWLRIKSDIRHVLDNVAFGTIILDVYRKLKPAGPLTTTPAGDAP